MRKTTLAALLLLLCNILFILFTSTLPEKEGEIVFEENLNPNLTALTHIDTVRHITSEVGRWEGKRVGVLVQVILKTVASAEQTAIVYPAEVVSLSIDKGSVRCFVDGAKARELVDGNYTYRTMKQQNMATGAAKSINDPKNALLAEYNQHCGAIGRGGIIILIKVPRGLQDVLASNAEDVYVDAYHAPSLHVRDYNNFCSWNNSRINTLRLAGKGDISINESTVDSLYINTQSKHEKDYFSAVDLQIADSRMGSLFLKGDCEVRGIKFNAFKHITAEPLHRNQSDGNASAFSLRIDSINKAITIK